jgi:hypothetical protein
VSSDDRKEQARDQDRLRCALQPQYAADTRQDEMSGKGICIADSRATAVVARGKQQRGVIEAGFWTRALSRTLEYPLT